MENYFCSFREKMVGDGCNICNPEMAAELAKDNVVVTMSWHLFVTCPNCKEYIDLVDHDDDGFFAKAIFNNEWGDLKGESTHCPKCNHEFFIAEVEY